MKTDLFSSCGHCWVFQTPAILSAPLSQHHLLGLEIAQVLGITSPTLALFIVILHKAHLISHSRMAGSRWVITPSWLSGLLRSFLYISSVYCFYLFLISSASKSIAFMSFIVPIFAWNVPLVFLIFFKRSLVLPILLFSSISLHWSWRKTSLSLLAIL